MLKWSATIEVERAGLAAVLLLVAAGCVYLPRVDPSVTTSQPPEPHVRLAKWFGGDAMAASRAVFVADAAEALTARLALIDNADVSLDAQYFIWQNDPTGLLVIRHMLSAADRGVRIRVLVDDIQLGGLVDRLHALDDHPNIEIRIFNPFTARLRYQLGLLRLAEFAIDGNRLNHRMHNKLLVADNIVAILGGRNIGDDYFDQSPQRNFVDSDILAAGGVVTELSSGFDVYWNSRWAYPVSALLSLPPMPVDLERVRKRIDQRLGEHPKLATLSASSAPIDRLAASEVLKGASTIADDPDVGWGDRPDELAGALTDIALTAKKRVLIVTPYLVLTPGLLEVAYELIGRGVEIRVLTNSLASNDVVVAHAAYSRYREEILAAGIELFEFRHDAAVGPDHPGAYSSLHSKYLIFDDEVVFVGSMNLDPRSLYLNTELGVVLTSRRFAAELERDFETLTHPDNAWRVLDTGDDIRWISSAGTVDRQPARNDWQRSQAAILGLLPISHQL